VATTGETSSNGLAKAVLFFTIPYNSCTLSRSLGSWCQPTHQYWLWYVVPNSDLVYYHDVAKDQWIHYSPVVPLFSHTVRTRNNWLWYAKERGAPCSEAPNSMYPTTIYPKQGNNKYFYSIPSDSPIPVSIDHPTNSLWDTALIPAFLEGTEVYYRKLLGPVTYHCI
jgi:hypothetical protein